METQENNHPETETESHEEGIAFYPLHFMKECMVVLGIIIALFALSSFIPAGVGEEASPFVTPQHIKPEWYFLAVYQSLKYVPKGNFINGFTFLHLAILAQASGFIILIILPFVDLYKYKRPSRRPLFTALGIFMIVCFIVLTYLGWFSGSKDPIFNVYIK